MASNGHARVEMKSGDSGSAGAARNSQTSRAVFIAVTAAALGITYGYDISNTAAALQFVQRDFGIYSAINTASVVGQIAGAILGGPMANAIGRKKSMLVIAAGYTIFAILTAISPSAGLFLAMRFCWVSPSGFPSPSCRCLSPNPLRRRGGAGWQPRIK